MENHIYKPLNYDNYNSPDLQKLLSSEKVVTKTDLFSHCLDELFEIEYPWLKPGDSVFAHTRERFLLNWKTMGPLEEQGNWVYYPWSQQLIHYPPENIYKRLRTARNRNLITEEEQEIIRDKCIGIAGMSVGSNILNTLVLSGGVRHLKIADMDTISVPNLNRIMAPASAVGLNKAVYFARKSFEVDPYLEIDVFDKGLSVDLLDTYFKEPKLDLFIEEMDQPYLKIESRKLAKKLRVPVIMAADNGDGALIDVERFDLEPDRPLFHGRFEGILDLDKVTEKLTFSERLTIIANMVHLEEATPRAQNSLEEVGTVLNTWPQLGTAAVTCGVALTFIARRILLGLPMPSGRYHLTLEETLVPGYLSKEQKRVRRQHTKRTMTNFNSFQKYIEDVSKI